MWWDSEKMELKIVLASQSQDGLENFQTAFRTMHPNASFLNMDRIITPVWYSSAKVQENLYQIFDGSLFHEHYSSRIIYYKTISQLLI